MENLLTCITSFTDELTIFSLLGLQVFCIIILYKLVGSLLTLVMSPNECTIFFMRINKREAMKWR